MAHPSFGPVPPEKFFEALSAPGGQAKRILREFDPNFGTITTGGNLKTFVVEVSCQVARRDYAIVEIEAADEAHAAELIHSMDWQLFRWSEGDSDESGNEGLEIECIEEKEPWS